MRLDTLGQLFTTSLAFYLVYGTPATASNIGFILSVSGELLSCAKRCHLLILSQASFSDTILWWVRNLNSFEGLSSVTHDLNIILTGLQ